MNSKQIGNIGEAKALSKFVELGIPVYIPFGDNEKSDLIAEFNGKLQRIQVKTSIKHENNKIIFSLVSSTMHRKNGIKHIYSQNEIDYFALYNLATDILLLVPISKVLDQKAITFRTDDFISKNQYTHLSISDYSFEKIVSVETVHKTSQVDEDTVQTTTE